MESGPKKALVLVGIMSRGINEECAGKEFPTLFVDVRKEAKWIYETMERLDGIRKPKTLFDSEAEERIHVSESAVLKFNWQILVIVLVLFLPFVMI